jgi:D-glutamate cyclase
MAAGADRRALIDRMERLIQTDVGRNIGPLCAAARGGLWGAAVAIANEPRCRVGLITGFFIPAGSPPAAETDGPIGTALLAKGLTSVGVPCRLATDEPCRNACQVALAAAGASDAPVDSAALASALTPLIDKWRAAGITHAISIERCGRSADGTPRNMRGLDIGCYTAPLDDLFSAGPWRTIAVGDGGNEIGMGALPRGLIAQYVEHGETIACVTPAQHLIVAGVSHWGAYALLGALALARADWRDKLMRCLDERLDRRVLEATLADGPAVDGVSCVRAPTIDNLDLDTHHEKLAMTRALAESGHAL